MPYADAEGAKLYYEETGSGFPIVFVHEFAGDLRSWEPQLRYFARFYRCIAYNARGFPPSDVPEQPSLYSQDIATDDIAAVMRGAGIENAHVVGLSMGGFAAAHFAMRYGALARSVVIAGCGYGADPAKRTQFKTEAETTADRLEREGMEKMSAVYGSGPTRVQLENKDPRGYREFLQQLAEHSVQGSANTLRGVQAVRPSLYGLEDELKAVDVPVLIVTGDEDEPCLDPGLFMKRTIPTSGLVVIPKTGHACNLEEPEAFNAALREFFLKVENGKWGRRDPRSVSRSILSRDET
ncbi:MAG: alpha/beta fold hydrolase [Alphaproteobacteria bacterium]|nr:alpha/beta fold hydrolase [Alphaproteobacteria bacterium]